MVIKASELQRATSLALAGCGQSNQIPISQLFGLKTETDEETEAKCLTICSTDTVNYLYVRVPVDTPEDFDVCVNAATFANLVSKTTVPEVAIEFVKGSEEEGAHVLLRGNGEYKLAIALFDNGYPMSFPEEPPYAQDADMGDEALCVSISDLKALETFAKPSLSTLESEVDLNGYYLGGTCSIATDRKTMAIIHKSLWLGQLVVRPKFIELVCRSGAEEAIVSKDEEGKCIQAITGDAVIWSTRNSPAENYPSKQIEALVNGSTFTLGCKVDPAAMAAALDRVSLMVTKYDSDLVDLVVVGGMMLVSSIKSTGSECIDIEPIDSDHPIDEEFSWSGRINCQWLIEQLTTFAEPEVEFWVGDKKCVKICSGNVQKLVCLA